MGEKHHLGALELSRLVARGAHQGICSALVLTEVPGALASSTTMPVDRIYETELSLLESFRVNVRPFEQYADRAVDLMFEFREMKRRLGINSADFHHLATATGEGCSIFVTTDERHLLKEETKSAFSGYVRICAPSEALLET